VGAVGTEEGEHVGAYGTGGVVRVDAFFFAEVHVDGREVGHGVTEPFLLTKYQLPSWDLWTLGSRERLVYGASPPNNKLQIKAGPLGVHGRT
jgi:hypothetical protein